jgi:hypothetical protein
MNPYGQGTNDWGLKKEREAYERLRDANQERRDSYVRGRLAGQKNSSAASNFPVVVGLIFWAGVGYFLLKLFC